MRLDLGVGNKTRRPGRAAPRALAGESQPRSRGTNVNGTLRSSNVRLTFTPFRISGRLGRAPWECALSNALHLAVAPKGILPWPARLERRLGLVHDGVVDVFEVGHVDTVADAIQRALAAIDH